ncbi:hypothetical protein [Paractinoplanes abujensis]|uniref:Uncharacterized protein n=1 Tax=Paractinoplanes abujensis TaxID=882441 RepID=A0A7W7G5W2_9ACTN|nr:hypothetical protein [Actinoplanes abujensis]MBB4696775.1 hypothetical protein [Actinoplanes abujensis]
MMTIQAMQGYIQNPSTEQHYELLTGWKRSADLINEHRWQVANYRDNLAAAWPPDKNAAAEAYITRLNELIDNLDETYEAAIANHDAFASATLSISLAQKEMNEIAQEYQANEQALATFTASQQPSTTSGQPTPTPSPSGEQPPVAPGRQEALHQRAVTLLNGVSSDLAMAQVKIQTPRPYRPNLGREETKGSDGGGGYAAPPIPPITPSFGSDAASSSKTIRPPAAFPTSPNVAPPSAPLPPAQQPGLILGGTAPTAPTAPVAGLPPGTPPVSGTPGPTPGPGLLPPSPSSFVPTGTSPLGPPAVGPGGRNAGLPREGAIRPSGPASGGMHVMPPGGVIGGAPGIGVAQPGGARPGAQRVNPIGGVIGGGTPGSGVIGGGTPGGRVAGAGGRANGAGITGQHVGTTGPYGQTGARNTSRRDQDDQMHWDPDNPWQTATGVDPVVLPPRDQRIDPGPAIGLN